MEVAPRMGATLKRGQDGQQFLQMVEPLRQQALAGLKSRSEAPRQGIQRRYDELLQVARRHGEDGAPRKMKDTLRTLHAASPERSEAAGRLGEVGPDTTYGAGLLQALVAVRAAMAVR